LQYIASMTCSFDEVPLLILGAVLFVISHYLSTIPTTRPFHQHYARAFFVPIFLLKQNVNRHT
jgi:hypothetical protein